MNTARRKREPRLHDFGVMWPVRHRLKPFQY